MDSLGKQVNYAESVSIAYIYHANPLTYAFCRIILYAYILAAYLSLITSSCYNANFVVTDGTTGCHNDKLRCH